MKRLASLVLAAGFTASALVMSFQGASATPFSDVPANKFAYEAIQSLAADGLIEGYPDGKFKGDRPLTRYEMAVIVARVIAKVQANGANAASKADLDKLQKLIDSLKDELDSLGVRVTNLEDSLDALDKRTKFAQSIQFHGTWVGQESLRERFQLPRGVTNTTGAPVTTYYGGAFAAGRSNGGIDPFVNAFISTPDSNDPLEQQGSGVRLRYDDKFVFSYAVNDNLTVSIPVHILNFNYGGEFNANTSQIGIQPDIVVNIKQAGALTNLYLRQGQIDNMLSSRTGLAFRAPQTATQGPLFEAPVQPYEKGFSMGGTLNGLTDFQFNFTRLDQTLLNTSTNVLDPQGTAGGAGLNGYLFYVARPQATYTQTGAAGSAATITSNTFSAGDSSLTQVFLTRSAVAGSIYVSAYNGTTYNNAGVAVNGGGAAVPNFTFNQQYNSIVFATPLPAGSTVTITYQGLNVANDDNWQRYHISGRVNQKFKGIPGAEIGFSFSRIYDYDDNTTTADQSTFGAAAVTGYGLVSDTVFGLDAQMPLPFFISNDHTSVPVLFGEVAGSKFSPDYRNVATVSDSAGVVGLRLKVYDATATLQYQSVGYNFMPGAPLRFYGNVPYLYSNVHLPYFPSFFGFGNNYGINSQFDSAVGTRTAGNPNLTFLDVVFNPFRASGPNYFSSFTPNTQGFTGSLNIPFRIGDIAFAGRVAGQSLKEIRPNAESNIYYGPVYATNTPERFDSVSGGLTFTAPIFAQKVAFNLSGSYEHLGRNDRTPEQYFPINPATQAFDTGSINSALGAFPGTAAGTPSFYPNYVDVRHYTYVASAAVPLTKGVSLGLNYSTQRFGGTSGTTLTQSIDERKDQYAGSLTYNIPNSNSQVTFLARENKYVDGVLSNFNFSQNRQDITFTVRF